MGKFAARVTDPHSCPMVTGLIPHVGGPILRTDKPTVKIGGLPAARLTDKCSCTGPTDTIVEGSKTVNIEGKPAARVGDATAHGGKITMGCQTVKIGG